MTVFLNSFKQTKRNERQQQIDEPLNLHKICTHFFKNEFAFTEKTKVLKVKSGFLIFVKRLTL